MSELAAAIREQRRKRARAEPDIIIPAEHTETSKGHLFLRRQFKFSRHKNSNHSTIRESHVEEAEEDYDDSIIQMEGSTFEDSEDSQKPPEDLDWYTEILIGENDNYGYDQSGFFQFGQVINSKPILNLKGGQKVSDPLYSGCSYSAYDFCRYMLAVRHSTGNCFYLFCI